MSFLDRVGQLPHLGIGVSTEYGASDGARALDVEALFREHPQYARFLEIGIETDAGLDASAEQWIAARRPCTYHYLDVNLEEREDLDPSWLGEVRQLVDRIRPAWLCGDAGMWHFGGRESGHLLLLPPVLCDDAASALADGVHRLRAAAGREVLPENPPGVIYLGDLHLLEFFARVCERADTGMLLDCAHLAIYQKIHGFDPLTGLDDFPLERIVEMHVAGGSPRAVDGFGWINDDHTTQVLPETWEILEHVVPRCPNLKAIVFECERNPVPDTLSGFARIASVWTGHDTEPAVRRVGEPAFDPISKVDVECISELESATVQEPDSELESVSGPVSFPGSSRPGSSALVEGARTSGSSIALPPSRSNALQRVMVRMLLDLRFAEQVLSTPTDALSGLSLPEKAVDWLHRPDPRAWRADLERPGRCRRVLLHEFGASLALIAARTGKLEVCDLFFRSPELHHCVQSRASLALTFGGFLQKWADPAPDPRVGAIARLETDIAALRRSGGIFADPGAEEGEGERDKFAPSTVVRLSPDHRLLETLSGTAALHAQILGLIDQAGVERADVVTAPPPLPTEALDFATPEFLFLELVRPEAARRWWLVGTAEITASLFALLSRAEKPIALRDLEYQAAALSDETEKVRNRNGGRRLLRELLAEGLLVRVPAQG